MFSKFKLNKKHVVVFIMGFIVLWNLLKPKGELENCYKLNTDTAVKLKFYKEGDDPDKFEPFTITEAIIEDTISSGKSKSIEESVPVLNIKYGQS